MPTKDEARRELAKRELLRRAQAGTGSQREAEFFQDFGAGVQRGAGQLARGAASLGAAVLPPPDFNPETQQQQLQALGGLEQQAAQGFQGAQERSPVASLIGQFTPALATAGVTGGTSLPGQLAANAGIGAVIGAGQDPANPLPGAGVGAGGGAVGTAVGQFLGRGILGLRGRVQEGLQGVAERTGAAENRLVSPGTLSGSEGAQKIENSLGNLIGGSGGIQKFQRRFETRIRTEASKAVGLPDDVVPNLDGLVKARKGIGKRFEEVRKVEALPVDDELLDILQDASLQFDEVAQGGRNHAQIALDDVLKAVDDNGNITGQEFDRISKRLRKAQRAIINRDFDTGEVLFEATDGLDNFLDRTAPDDVLQTLQTARQQWKNLLALEAGAATNRATGNVNAKSALNNLLRIDKSIRAGQRQDDFTDLLVLGNAPNVANPNSAASALQFGQLAAGGALGASLVDESPALGAVGGAAASPVVASALTKLAVGSRGGPAIGALLSRILSESASDTVNSQND